MKLVEKTIIFSHLENGECDTYCEKNIYFIEWYFKP